jgi:Na+-driven multidrug efflux pump
MDMTKGSIRRNLILFIIPLALGNVLQQLYNITDVFILGRYVGSDALAAVGAVAIMTFVFNAIIFGLKAGISIVCSTHF